MKIETINKAGGCGHERCQNYSCIMQEFRSLLQVLEGIASGSGLTITTDKLQGGLLVTLTGQYFHRQWLWPYNTETLKADWCDTFRSYAKHMGEK